ncbi:MAG: hypothetical protein DKM50_00335 [Candidatus Margulisiibacteriota bacterium]|nr:MAG: hypothetical protein A2X43_06550 [Candidatus Margulisbacteria bacterium GWD2_39_127]PZM84865.1 MAG: hypothetical protein DKM50_00335 [Candidatus Margulisiibacteriota bacterium]HAR64050.1 hypothetical protein [Candidatus Margulisiibacteriota bacterium]HCY38183.1 hypothetical protein [Candidatus Margulisiibacteriota bacterium]
MKGVVRLEQPVNFIDKIDSFTIMGDPGCDGLGAEIMTTFSKALSLEDTDFKIILGDLVPFGMEQFYGQIYELINEVALSPVYTLCGNHDTEYYSKYFGLRNYCLLNNDLLIVMLDDSRRVFEAETLDFLREILAKHHRRNILVTFHIPPPNNISPNSIRRDEWVKLRSIMDPYKSQIKYVLSGHVHSYFRDNVDGYEIIVSAGAGARLEFLGRLPEKKNSFHHILQFYFDSNSDLKFYYRSLADVSYNREENNQTISKYLLHSFMSESSTHMRYQLFADDAYDKGYLGTEKLFRVLAKSAFYHARSYFSVLNQLFDINSNFIQSEHLEGEDRKHLSTEYVPQALDTHAPLALYAFNQTYAAKTNYSDLLPEAIKAYEEGSDIERYTYFVCSSCGNTGVLTTKLERCPICGAPLDKIITM